jgi:hypothetical protein|nr:MAG TPA: hypothetical protein [Caudoviricetes sp.]
MAYLTVMHELHGELYMENRHGLFKFVPKPAHSPVSYEWLELGYCGEDRWLRRLREVRDHPDTVSWVVD